MFKFKADAALYIATLTACLACVMTTEAALAGVTYHQVSVSKLTGEQKAALDRISRTLDKQSESYDRLDKLLKQNHSQSYPVRGDWWTGPNGASPLGYGDGVRHLQGGEHRGKFDPQWLASLNAQQLNSLHSDDHEGRVKWQYAKRPSIVSASRSTYGRYTHRGGRRYVRGNCPGGFCPAN